MKRVTQESKRSTHDLDRNAIDFGGVTQTYHIPAVHQHAFRVELCGRSPDLGMKQTRNRDWVIHILPPR